MSNTLLNQARGASKVEDQTEVKKGDFDNLPAKGKAPARFVGYVELGTHPQPDYQGQAKPPAVEVRLTFEVFGKNNMHTSVDETTGKETHHGKMLNIKLTKKLNVKAKYTKLFNSMKGSRDVKHMAEMLNEVFMLDIDILESKRGRKFATVSHGGTMHVSPPLIEKFDETGELVGTTDISDKVPQASMPLRLFLVDSPTIEQWDSLFIEGTYEFKDKDADGAEVTTVKSKNFLQDMIKESLDFQGSAMDVILRGLADGRQPEVKEVEAEEDDEVTHEDDDDDEDMLVELGLV